MPYRSELYMHDLDRKATAALNTFPKLTKFLEAYRANFDEKVMRFTYLSEAIRLSDKQMPEIYGLLPPVCERLGIDVPELYYVKSKDANAWTYGTVQPYIVVTSRLVNILSPELVASVLAHECGHIACKHNLYHSIALQLIRGIDNSPLALIPAIRRFLTPALTNAFLFWDRCSELSADRASVLCDGGPDRIVDALLRIHGYGDKIDRAEFLKQAMDLKAFVNDSTSNKLIEQMLIQGDSHPRLATRAYECYEWSKSPQYCGIVDGTYTVQEKREEEYRSTEEEVITAQLTVTGAKSQAETDLDTINRDLQQVETKLARYTNTAGKTDYAVAVGSGLLAGAVDSLFVGEFNLLEADEWGNEKVSEFVVKVAQSQGYAGDAPEKAIKHLEDTFHIAADAVKDKFGGGGYHHLRDFSHHPTPVGLVCSILTQFTWRVYGTDGNGMFKAERLDDKGMALVGKTPGEKITLGVINWVFHMVSDMAGSSDSVKKGSLGTGLPGPLVSLMKELSATPLFKKTNTDGQKEYAVFVANLFQGSPLASLGADNSLTYSKFDLRTELGVGNYIGRQTIPVILNECFVRAFYFIRRLTVELASAKIETLGDFSKLPWDWILPYRNRTMDRMLAVASMTFTVADTADATIRAAIESGANWVLFSGRFVTRFNYVGAGRAAVAIVREISNEKKEIQLIHEKMLLSEAKASLFIEQLHEFEAKLEEKVSNYLAEDITAFMEGFDFMEQGLASGDSDLVIRGNVIIQKVLGREPQFTSQEEFDALMGSDIPLTL